MKGRSLFTILTLHDQTKGIDEIITGSGQVEADEHAAQRPEMGQVLETQRETARRILAAGPKVSISRLISTKALLSKRSIDSIDRLVFYKRKEDL